MNTSILNIISRAQKSYQLEILDTQILIAHTLKKPREWVVSHPEFSLPWLPNFKIQRLFRLRAKGVPVAYLTGHKEFFGLDFIVNKHTLVPRPDTEILVENVLSVIARNVVTKQSILIDIGTGSGCIPISIQKTLQQKNPSLSLETFATDISKNALKIAKRNSQRHKTNITFLQGNLLEPILKNQKSLSLISDSQIILTANLPYLTQTQFEQERSIQHEPHSALVADDQGLALYKTLLGQIKQSGNSLTAWFEIDPSQAVPLSTYIQDVFPQAKIEIIKDLCGRERTIKFESFLSLRGT